MTGTPSGDSVVPMFTYADSRVCPSCRSSLPPDPGTTYRCGICHVPLDDPLAGRIFTALRGVDELVEELRAVSRRQLAEAAVRRAQERQLAASIAAPAAVSSPPAPARADAPPPPVAAPPRASGLRTTSVPVILLGLGALCLLVAAVIFLAVAWSALGIGGRTAVLVVLTATSGGLGLWLGRRGLRVASEALTTVALGLLAVDVAGAESAGWLGRISENTLAAVIGLSVAAAAAGLVSIDRRLGAPQLIGVLAFFVGALNLSVSLGWPQPGTALLVLALMLLAGACDDLPIARWTAVVVAAVAWLLLLSQSVDRLFEVPDLTYPDVFGSWAGPGLGVAGLLLLTPLLLSRHEVLLQICAAGTASWLSVLVLLPILDEGVDAVTLASVLASVAWTSASAALPHRRAAVAALPAAVTLTPGALVGLVVALQAVVSVATPDADLRLDPESWTSPLLFLPIVLAVLALSWALARPQASRRWWIVGSLGLVWLGLVATLALYPVPLWTVVAALLVPTALLAAASSRPEIPSTLALVVASAFGGLAVLSALPSVPLLMVAVTATLAVLALLARQNLAAGGESWVVIAGLAGAAVWLTLVLRSLSLVADVDPVTVGAWFGAAATWGLLLAGALLLVPLVANRGDDVLQPVAAAAGTMLSLVLAWPVSDNGVDAVAAASLLVAAAWTAATVVLPRRLVVVGALPAGVTMLPALGLVLVAASEAASAVAEPTASLRLDASADATAWWAIVPVAVLLVALVTAVVRPRQSWRADWLRASAVVVALAGVTTLATRPVPLWSVVAALVLVAGVLGAEALRRPRGASAAGVAATLLGLALLVSGPHASVLVIPAATATALALAALTVGRFAGAATAGGLAAPAVATLTVWTAGDLVGPDHAWLAVPCLVVAGALALVWPRLEVELVALPSALVALVASVQAADDRATTLAVLLTVLGALLTAHAVVHAERRPVAWAGGAVLALASWVRLGDLGIETPEAYTLPTAVALTLVAVLRIVRDPRASSRSLLPGLVLGVLPSLTWVVLVDPVSLRAALLGMGCLALVLAGVTLRWAVPLLVGAGAGAVIALVELAPFAAATPQWVLLGLAGVVLTVVGVTWESRLNDVRRAAAYVGRLR